MAFAEQTDCEHEWVGLRIRRELEARECVNCHAEQCRLAGFTWSACTGHRKSLRAPVWPSLWIRPAL